VDRADKPKHPTFRPPSITIRKPPYEVRRLGWGTFTLEAEIVLKEPYSWNVNTGGAKQSSLELAWTLVFQGRGKQGRVRSKVRKFQEAPLALTAGRTLRPRAPPVVVSHLDDGHEEHHGSDMSDNGVVELHEDDDEDISEFSTISQ
jgi:hypothetical protein